MKKIIYNLREWCGTNNAIDSKNVVKNKGSGRAAAAFFLGIAALAILFNIITCGACSDGGPLSCFTECICGSMNSCWDGCVSCYSCLYCGG